MANAASATCRFQMVDVFAEQPLYGNSPPVVVDEDGLSGEDVLRITRWMNQSETTFLLPPTDPKADYRNKGVRALFRSNTPKLSTSKKLTGSE